MTITHVLAVAFVSDIDRATTWYEQLLGRPAEARPMETLADWHVTDGGWLSVFVAPPRAGGTAVNFAVDDFDQTCRTVRDRGFDVGGAWDTPRGVRLLPLADPDGNTITFIGNVVTE
jgi:predicted enzyme related to lactoylglutathione lyase